MKITMTGFAKQQIRETAKYIYTEFGKKSKDDFIFKLNQTRKLQVFRHLKARTRLVSKLIVPMNSSPRT